MVGAFLYRDICLLRYRARSFLMLILSMACILALLKFGLQGMGAGLFGVDFVRLFLLSLVGLGAFMEHYGTSLAVDKRDGVLAVVMVGGMSKLRYFVAKVLVPIVVAAIATLFLVFLYLGFIDSSGFSTHSFLFLLVVIGSELFLAMGLGMLLNLLWTIDINESPGMAIPMLFVNVPLLYLANPMHHFMIFVVATAGLGVVCYAGCVVTANIKYRSNLVLPDSRCRGG